jgi:hypothetical protein
MGSETRAREAFLSVRMDAAEEAWIVQMAYEQGVTKAELARAIIFGRSPRVAVVPCNDAHVGCTRQHRDLVDSYRDQRYREELELENETGLYRGDLEFWHENGGRLTTFRQWLDAHKTAGRD